MGNIGRGDMCPFADFPRGHCRTPQSFGKDANHYLAGSHHSCYGRPNARSHPAATASFRLQSRPPNVVLASKGQKRRARIRIIIHSQTTPTRITTCLVVAPVAHQPAGPNGPTKQARLAGCPQRLAAIEVQAICRGWLVRKEQLKHLLRVRRSELDDALAQAAAETAKFEPWVFERTGEEKMLNGVPVCLLQYEEQLLRIQLKLDAMQSAPPVAHTMRHWRKRANQTLQARLDLIDACRDRCLATEEGSGLVTLSVG